PVRWIDPSGLTKQDPYYGDKYKDPGFREYLERTKRDRGYRRGDHVEKEEMEKIYEDWVGEGRRGREKENKGREKKNNDSLNRVDSSWMLPALVGTAVVLTRIVQPELCVPAVVTGAKVYHAQ